MWLKKISIPFSWRRPFLLTCQEILITKQSMPQLNFFNPLTLGAFCKKGVSWTFWWFLGWILVKLPSIWSKMHLHHDSLTFLPLASGRFHSGMRRNKNLSFWRRKWPMSLGFSIFGFFFSPFLFLLFFSFCCSDWPSTGLACG